MTFNYSQYFQGLKSPLDVAMDGFEGGFKRQAAMEQSIFNSQQRALKQQEAAAAKQALENKKIAIRNFIAKPGKTAQDYINLATLYPDIGENTRKNFEIIDEDQRQSLLDSGSRIFAAYRNNRPDIAEEELLRMRQSGIETGNRRLEDMAQSYLLMHEESPEMAEAAIGLSLGAIDKNFTDNMVKTDQNIRDRDLHPLEIKARVQAIKNKAQEYNLTGAQIKKILVDTEGLQAQTAKTFAEIEGIKKENNGILPQKEKLKAETDLRKEYLSETKKLYLAEEQLAVMESIFEDMQNRPVQSLGPSDLAAIITFIKANDPDSTVTESEGRLVGASAGLVGTFQSMINKALSQGTLNDNVREGLLITARKLVAPRTKKLKDINERYGKIARESALDIDNITIKEPLINADPGAADQNVSDKVLASNLEMMQPGANNLLGIPQEQSNDKINALLDKYAPYD